MMNKKRILIALLVFLVFGGTIQAQADVSVRGYYRKDGTYVRPHMRSDPDGNFNNYLFSKRTNDHLLDSFIFISTATDLQYVSFFEKYTMK